MPVIIDLGGDSSDDEVVEIPPPARPSPAPVVDLCSDSDSSCSCSSCNNSSDDEEAGEMLPFTPAAPPAHTYMASHTLGPPPLLITPTTPPALGSLIVRYMLRCLVSR